MFFYPSSTCRIDIPRLILVPSAHTQSGWGWLKKAGEYGSVRCRVLNGSKGSFPRLFTLSSIPFSIGTDILDFFPSCFYTIFALSSVETLDWPRTESSSAVSLMLFCTCITVSGPRPSSTWAFGPQRINGASPKIVGPHKLIIRNLSYIYLII